MFHWKSLLLVATLLWFLQLINFKITLIFFKSASHRRYKANIWVISQGWLITVPWQASSFRNYFFSIKSCWRALFSLPLPTIFGWNIRFPLSLTDFFCAAGKPAVFQDLLKSILTAPGAPQPVLLLLLLLAHFLLLHTKYLQLAAAVLYPI